MEKLLQSLDTAVAITWSRLHNGFLPDEPRLQFTVLTSLVHAIAVYSSALFFMFLKHFSWCKRFRIQGDKEPDRKLVRKCQIHMMISCLISFPTVMYFIVYPISRRSVSHISPAPSASSIFAHLILFVVCEDCMFYWLHRASHHPYLYSYVHKQHHEFKINHPLCFHYSTILEGLFVNTVSSLFAPAFMQAHTFTFCIWFFIRVVETVDAHSGYRLPFSPWQILDSVQGGSERHDFHHSKFQGSYGSFFCFWDWLCGTDVPYRAHQLTQIASGAGLAAGVRGGSIFFNGGNREHRAAFQQLANSLLKSDTSVHVSCHSHGSEVSIAKAVELVLQDNFNLTLRWTV